MSSPIKPMAHYVVAAKEKKPEKTASGIFLPESAQEKSEVDKEEYLIIKDEDILATIE